MHDMIPLDRAHTLPYCQANKITHYRIRQWHQRGFLKPLLTGQGTKQGRWEVNEALIEMAHMRWKAYLEEMQKKPMLSP